MPTNANAYNSRLTDEALEKRFRDTFRSQGGAELVDDLYASGVIVPVVDFTQAAEGSQLPQNLQTAWDYTTGHATVSQATTPFLSTAGFWKVLANIQLQDSSTFAFEGVIGLTDGLSVKPIWELNTSTSGATGSLNDIIVEFVVFLRSGDSLYASSNAADLNIDVSYRQIATASGDLVNPSGFTSS